MAQRSELQALLVQILGNNNVYHQPPPSLTMAYPCIVYKLDDLDSTFANNRPYNHLKRYQVTYITKDPENDILWGLVNLPLCSFERAFVADNLKHQVYNLFF